MLCTAPENNRGNYLCRKSVHPWKSYPVDFGLVVSSPAERKE
jgi:hypothetical protein